MSTVHRNLTGADLHEPKGADTALSGQVYVSNGVGSGSWTDASSIITNSAFTTGDYKLTGKVTADSGWIMYTYGTIGDGSSSATVRANADTSALFTLYWNNYSNTLCPVSGGRGASAAADFAAHKTLTLPDMSQRVLGIAGSYNAGGLTSRTLGFAHGAETATLSTVNLPPYTPTGTNGSISVGSGGLSIPLTNGSVGNTAPTGGGSKNSPDTSTSWSSATSLTGSAPAFTGTAQGGTSTPFSIYQPTAYVNLMIKL